MSIFLDTFSGTDNSAWNSTHWQAVSKTANGEAAQYAGTGQLWFTTSTSSGYISFLDNYTARTDQEIVGDIFIPSDATSYTKHFVGIAIVKSGAGKVASTVTNGVWLQFNNDVFPRTITLHYAVGGTQTSLGTVYSGYSNNNTLSFRLQLESNVVRARIWSTGSAEPGTWNYNNTVVGTFSSGKAMVAHEQLATSNSNDNVKFDNIEVAEMAAVPVSVTASVATGSGLSPDSAVSTQVTVSAEVATGSLSAPDAAGKGNTFTSAVVDGAHTNASFPSSNYNLENTWYLSTTQDIFIHVNTPDLEAGKAIQKVYLNLNVHSTETASRTITASRITSSWSASTITAGSEPSAVTGPATTVSPTAGQWVSIDITSIVTDWISGQPNHGIKLTSASSLETRFYKTTYNAAYITTIVTDVTGVTVVAEPASLSGVAVDPGVGIGDGFNPGPASGTGVSVDPTIFVVKNNEVAVLPAEGTADAPGGEFSLNVTVSAEASTALGEATDVQVEATQGVLFEAIAATGTMKMVRPALVNDLPIIENEADDVYFQRVMAIGPSAYYRMQEDNGSTVLKNRMSNGLSNNMLATNVRFGRFDGPDNRPSAYFDGTAMLAQDEQSPNESLKFEEYVTKNHNYAYAPAAVEFTIRTTKQNQFVMAGSDYGVSKTGGILSGIGATEVYISDGKLEIRKYSPFNSSVQGSFSGFTNVADGEWHHIVIRSVPNKKDTVGSGTEVIVDGKLDVRRYMVELGFRVPDYIGSRPAYFDTAYLPPLPSSDNFVGDMSEIAVYAIDSMSMDTIARNYYAFMAWAPIEAGPITGEGYALEASGRGNQKKALLLYWSDALGGRVWAYDTQNWRNPMTQNMSPVYTLQGRENTFDYGGFKVVTKYINGPGPGSAYYDSRTDERRLLDLTVDVDLDNYDVIMFHNWPDEGSQFGAIESMFGPDAYEKLVGQIRDAAYAGKGLLVSHYQLALDLGIIDDVEYVWANPERVKTGWTGYDYGSAYKFPWNIAGYNMASASWPPVPTEPAAAPDRSAEYLRRKAPYYADTNTNVSRFRVRALVEGLTDIPGHILSEAVYSVSSQTSTWADRLPAYRYENRESGLQIGDEFYYYGADLGRSIDDSDFGWTFARYSGVWAVPPGGVAAGTVVTTLGATYWEGEREVTNEYGNHATTIVLQPGDVLRGRAVQGRIFVQFSESGHDRYRKMPKQILPAESFEHQEQKEWDWSFTRFTQQSTSTGSSQGQVVVVDSQGNVTQVFTGGGAATEADQGGTLVMTRYYSIYPVEYVNVLGMYPRGLSWLRNTPEMNPGDAVIRVGVANGTGEVTQTQVSAQRDATISASPAYGVATAGRVAESIIGDADIITLPAIGSGMITGFGKTVSVGPATGSGMIPENFDMVYASGEVASLYLHGYDAVVFIKEEV